MSSSWKRDRPARPRCTIRCRLVYTTRGDDVRHTVVNGRVLMRDRKVLTLDARRGAGRGARLGRKGPGGRPLGTSPSPREALAKLRTNEAELASYSTTAI